MADPSGEIAVTISPNPKHPSGEVAVTISPNPKKKAGFDRRSVKNILDVTAIEIVKSKGYVEDKTLLHPFTKLLEGSIRIASTLFAQFFYLKKFPSKKNELLIICYIFYFRGIMLLIDYLMVRLRHVFLFTYPAAANSRFTTGLALSSKLPRCSNQYTLTIASAEPGSAWAKPPVKLTKSFTQWFASDGVLLENLYHKDVEGLLNDYVKESNKSTRYSLFWCLIPGLLEMFLLLLLFALIH